MRTYLLTPLRSLALLVVLVAAAAGSSALTAEPARAAQANQEWFGSNDVAGNADYGWYYLGNPIAWPASLQIHTANGGRCLDLNGNNFFSWPMNNGWPLNATQVQLWDCKSVTDVSGFNQRWVQQNNGDGSWTYYVSSTYNAWLDRPFCLDSLGGHHYDGSPVEVWACNLGSPDAAQRWTIGPGGQLQSVDSPGFCADATNWGSGDGTPIQLWQCAY